MEKKIWNGKPLSVLAPFLFLNVSPPRLTEIMWLSDPLLYTVLGFNDTVPVLHGIITKMEPNVQTCARIQSPLTVVKASIKVGLKWGGGGGIKNTPF